MREYRPNRNPPYFKELEKSLVENRELASLGVGDNVLRHLEIPEFPIPD